MPERQRPGEMKGSVYKMKNDGHPRLPASQWMSSARTVTRAPKVIILTVAEKEPDQLLLDDLKKHDFPWGKEKLNWELRDIHLFAKMDPEKFRYSISHLTYFLESCI